jgi:hypothetical protein
MVTPIFCNNAFGYGRGLVNKLDDVFFECHGNGALRNALLGITWKDLTVNGTLLSREEILTHHGIPLTRAKYNIMKQVYQISIRKYHKVGGAENSLSDFFKSFKKGSKKFRIILSGTVSEQLFTTGQQVNSFLQTIEEERPAIPRIKALCSNWNLSFLPSSIREFNFKYYNNILGLNSRVAHFNMGINAGCTFCTINNDRPVPKETIPHLFYFCPTTSKIIDAFYLKYVIGIENSRKNFFLAEIFNSERINNVLNIVWDVFRYIIWQFKLRQQVPTYGFFDAEIQYQFAIINSSSRRFYDALIDCPFLQTHRQGDGLSQNRGDDERRP